MIEGIVSTPTSLPNDRISFEKTGDRDLSVSLGGVWDIATGLLDVKGILEAIEKEPVINKLIVQENFT